MSVERPRRNAKKLPDPDFFVDLPPSFSPTRGQRRRSSIDEGLEFLDELMIAIPERSPQKPLQKLLVKSPKAKVSPQKSPTTNSKSPSLAKKTPQKSPGVLLSIKSPKKTIKISPLKTIKLTPKKTPPRAVNKIEKSPALKDKAVPKYKPVTPKKSPTSKTTLTACTKKELPKNKTTPVKVEQPRFKSKVPLKSQVSPVKRRILKSTATTPKCRVACCTSKNTFCFVGTKSCAGSGHSARWYHISSSEHYCNTCFEYYYRNSKEGHSQYIKWRRKWSSNSQNDPSSPLFMSDQLLPYWLQCHKCNKWRQVPYDTEVNYDVIKQFTCGRHMQGEVRCSDPEDERIRDVQELNWIASFSVMPYLDRSPAAPYLQNYYPDGCGMTAFIISSNISTDTFSKDSRDGFDSESSISTSSSSSEEIIPERRPRQTSSVKPGAISSQISTQIEFFQPFHQPEEAFRAYTLPPDSMLDFELASFAEFANSQQMYLGLRNLVMTLWCRNYREWLTAEKCMPYVICRGLGRVRAMQEVGRIIDFLTRRGYINQGMLIPPKQFQLQPDSVADKEGVIVVGAGPAGLAAARQLSRFGVPVTVLEARDRIGGRVWDNNEMSVPVGHGAMIVVGHINNPITLLCHQFGLRTRRILDHCDLFTIDGQLTEANLDHRIEVHFNSILDSIAEWRRTRSQAEDSDLLTQILAAHKEFLKKNDMAEFTEEENLLLQFHISNLEYACGCELSHVSALQWDQNEVFPQFMGLHSMIKDGYSALFDKLSDNLHLELNTEVTGIEYIEENVKVTTRTGKVFEGSKVIVSLPLALLQQKQVSFTPPLPESKVEAINSLGAGIIEKVVLEFPERFWDDKLQGADFFGLVPPTETERGLFGVFYDITPRDERYEVTGHVLMTWVSGSAIRLIENKSDQEVIEMCMSALRKVFADKDVCEPKRWFVTRWGQDPYSRMSYSYVPVGSSGQMYAAMAQDVNNTLFFAGEATNRQFPQTVTGAYLSGIREADKILATLLPPFVRHELIKAHEQIPGKRGRKATFMKAVQMPIEENHSWVKKKKQVPLENSAKPETKKLQPKAKPRTSTAWVRAPNKRPQNGIQKGIKANGVTAKQNALKKTPPPPTTPTERSGTAQKRRATVQPSQKENGVSSAKRRGRPPKNSPTPPKPPPPVIKPVKVTPPVIPKQRNGQEVRRSRRIRYSFGEDIDQNVSMETDTTRDSPRQVGKSGILVKCDVKDETRENKSKEVHTGVSDENCVKKEMVFETTEETKMEISMDVKTEDATDSIKDVQNEVSNKDSKARDYNTSAKKSPKKSPCRSGGDSSNLHTDNGISVTIKEGGDGNRQSVSPGKRNSIKLKLRVGKLTDTTNANHTASQPGAADNVNIKLKTGPLDEPMATDDVSDTMTRVYEVLAVETDDLYDVPKETLPSGSSNGTLSPRTPSLPRLSPQVAELSDHDYF